MSANHWPGSGGVPRIAPLVSLGFLDCDHGVVGEGKASHSHFALFDSLSMTTLKETTAKAMRSPGVDYTYF